MTDASAYDVAVVGTGPAGLAAALSLAQQGLRVAAIGAPPPRRDTRTAALFGGSVTLLENLGLSAVCRTAGEPIYGIRIVDDMGALLRAPEVTFTANEAGLDRLGFNIPNAALIDAMRIQAKAVPAVSLIDAAVAQVDRAHRLMQQHGDRKNMGRLARWRRRAGDCLSLIAVQQDRP